MQEALLSYLRCPVTHQKLSLKVISKAIKNYGGIDIEIIDEGILLSDDFCYPIIKGIPRLLVEAFVDYEIFLQEHLIDFAARKQEILNKHKSLVAAVIKKNSHTKKSFELEWNLFNYETDTTWNANKTEMLDRFLREVDETKASIKNKIILDAGCGNGLLNNLIANEGAIVLGFDFSLSVEKAYQKNTNPNAWFVQADVQFPPVAFESFDIVHCSGVLIHTNNTEHSFSCLIPFVKSLGKLSVWLYHPRKNWIHSTFNFIRKFTSKLPLQLQYYLYLIFLFPPTYIIKKLKQNSQNKREMMIDILDWMTPEFRWEHTHEEAANWFTKRNFNSVKVTTNEVFGFNIIGIKH
jgi:2-polyprenyl-3-methyl-5-hydroxy-6-metoxy-1,4-benzoquinol methylase/uncharacterized protein YbaR (Trm112 family)